MAGIDFMVMIQFFQKDMKESGREPTWENFMAWYIGRDWQKHL